MKILDKLWRDETLKSLYGGTQTMTRAEQLAATIIDRVCDEVEKQHPEVITYPDESGDPNVSKAMIHGIPYYELEQDIASLIEPQLGKVILAGAPTVFQITKESQDSPFVLHIKQGDKETLYLMSPGQRAALDAASHDALGHGLQPIEGGTYGDS